MERWLQRAAIQRVKLAIALVKGVAGLAIELHEAPIDDGLAGLQAKASARSAA